MRPSHIAFATADTGDAVERPVRIGTLRDVALCSAVPENDTPFALEFGEGVRIAEVIPLAVRDWHTQNLLFTAGRCERRIRALYPNVNVLANEPQITIPQQRTRQ